MPHNPVLDSPLPNGSISPSHPSPIPTRGSLSPERSAALLARARDIIAGRLRPDPLPDWPGADARLQADFGDKIPPPTVEAVRAIKEDWSLEYNYPGQGIVTYRMDNGILAVLGAGDEEILLLLRGLSIQERSNVVVLPNDPF